MSVARVVGTVVLLAAIALPLGGAEAATAKEILDATGVKGGLVIHIGCGNGKLTAALRANESYSVHGLDTDPANVAAARKTVQAAGLYGKVAIDRLDGNRDLTGQPLLKILDPGFAPTKGGHPSEVVRQLLLLHLAGRAVELDHRFERQLGEALVLP